MRQRWTCSLYVGGGVDRCETSATIARRRRRRGRAQTMAITANMHINGNLLSNARANESESTGRACADRGGRCLAGLCQPLHCLYSFSHCLLSKGIAPSHFRGAPKSSETSVDCTWTRRTTRLDLGADTYLHTGIWPRQVLFRLLDRYLVPRRPILVVSRQRITLFKLLIYFSKVPVL